MITTKEIATIETIRNIERIDKIQTKQLELIYIRETGDNEPNGCFCNQTARTNFKNKFFNWYDKNRS